MNNIKQRFNHHCSKLEFSPIIAAQLIRKNRPGGDKSCGCKCVFIVIVMAWIVCAVRPLQTGPRFTNGFVIAIQILWKFRFTLTSILIQWSLQFLVRGTTALLLSHVQKFVAIWWPAMELQQGEISIEFELRTKKSLVKRAPGVWGVKEPWFYVSNYTVQWLEYNSVLK